MKYKLLFLLLVVFSNLSSIVWVNPNQGKCDYSYVFAPGIFCSEIHLAKYRTPFRASSGEIISCDCGIKTIGDKSVACNFAEIAPKRLKSRGSRIVTKPIRFITGYFTRKRGIKVDLQSGDGNHSVIDHSVKIFKINIGQDQDVEIYRDAVEKQLVQNEGNINHKVILYGQSRGSATVFNYFAYHDSPEVAAVVCEGVFDSVPNIGQSSNWLTKAKIKMLQQLRGIDFKVDGMSPLAGVDLIKEDKPIALITSENDKIVPMMCTVNLYKKLRDRGFSKVHLLRLKSASHSVYPTSDEKDQYQAFMHAFYKKYNLPYVPEYAIQGQEILKQSQPDL